MKIFPNIKKRKKFTLCDLLERKLGRLVQIKYVTYTFYTYLKEQPDQKSVYSMGLNNNISIFPTDTVYLDILFLELRLLAICSNEPKRAELTQPHHLATHW